MSLPTSENPDEDRPRPKWRKRRRKWYVKLWHNYRDRFLALGWRGRSAVGAAAALLLVILFFPYDDPGMKFGADIAGRDPIECLLPGQSEFRSQCTVEKIENAGRISLIVRSPDGDFRRLAIAKDGRGVSAADGAEQASVKPAGPDSIDVRAGDIVWRLPATVKE